METNRQTHQMSLRGMAMTHGDRDSHLEEDLQVQDLAERQVEMTTAINRATVTDQTKRRLHRPKHRHRNLPEDPMTHLEALTTRQETLLVAHQGPSQLSRGAFQQRHPQLELVLS